MTLMDWTGARSAPVPLLPAGAARVMLLVVIGAAAVGSFAVPGTQSAEAVAGAGQDLTRLLRLMALIKAGLALGALGGIVWRLGVPVTLPRLVALGAAGAAMAAGPGLIWGMAHVGLGALLLHGGLAASVVLLWRDPAVAARLATLLARRRAVLRR